MYRPGQRVKFKLWVRKAKYDLEGPSEMAEPRNLPSWSHQSEGRKAIREVLQGRHLRRDEGQLELPYDATLGMYAIRWMNLGRDLPRRRIQEAGIRSLGRCTEEPVIAGEKMTATIKG